MRFDWTKSTPYLKITLFRSCLHAPMLIRSLLQLQKDARSFQVLRATVKVAKLHWSKRSLAECNSVERQ